MADSIKIVVRVRPFNSNEEGQTNIVQMIGDHEVHLKNPENNQIRKFGFHRCYWSTDESRGKPPVDNMFVFNDIGKQILEHIYQGYNSTVFAYGQTGSGKSYSIEGYQQKGLLQLCLADIFKRRRVENDQKGVITSVRVSYLQIYNEKLRDLLNPKSDSEIKVQSSGTQIFIQGVQPVLCESFEQVQKLFYDGKKIRVIGAHAMNKNSSRSHAVFTIYYKEAGAGKMIQSKFNIVDLAGSERQSKTGATGVRLQEANNINKSLTNLGIVIEALAKNCQKKSNAFIPYRNSLLTHILSESLCGNSKTFMIAAISPASSNYQQTLSTLRFAQRASMITTNSKKNVQQKDGYNIELLEEIQRLKQELNNSQGKHTHSHSHSVSIQYITIEQQKRAQQLEARIKKMMDELQNNKNALEDMQKQLQQEKRKKQEMQENRNKALLEAGLNVIAKAAEEDQKLPYIMNISEDPTLAGMLIYKLKEGQTAIGTNEAEQNHIKLNVLGIMKRHCSIFNLSNKIYIQPKSDSPIYLNGLVETSKKQLHHLDRISMGHGNTFKLVIPGNKIVDDLRLSMAFKGKYGQFLDDRLNSNSNEAKNMKTFLNQLQNRLNKNVFSRFLEKFKNYLQDIDQVNQYTIFRYKKYPLHSRNIQFKINVIIDIQNYMKGQPSLIIICQHRQTKEIQFIWSEDKLQSRLAQMQTWYSDVNSNETSSATFYQFDPWFDATDDFIKEKEKIQILKGKQLQQFWDNKKKQNNDLYKDLLKEQNTILQKLKQLGVTPEQVENYADFYFRFYDIPEKNKKSVQQLHNNKQIHGIIKRFMECCAQAQKCVINNKSFNQTSEKYGNSRIIQKGGVNQSQYQKVQIQNLQLNEKIQDLQTHLKTITKSINKRN